MQWLRAADCQYKIRSKNTPTDFLDPPYNAGILLSAAEGVAEVMNPHGIIICEHSERTVMPENIGNFVLKKRYRYGKTAVSLYRGSAELE